MKSSTHSLRFLLKRAAPAALALSLSLVTGCVTTAVAYPDSAGPYDTGTAGEDVQAAPDPEFDSISPYGHWWWADGYGYVFSPSVSVGWRPYLYGHWASSPDGWLWVSDEPFGWATYHYGRWTYLNGTWAWIPGHQWAPAWVEWRTGPDYVGWVPYGLEAYPVSYVFVERRYFLEPRVYHNVMPVERNTVYVRQGAVLHHGPDRVAVERAAGRPAPFVSHNEERRVEPRARPVSPAGRPIGRAPVHRGPVRHAPVHRHD